MKGVKNIMVSMLLLGSTMPTFSLPCDPVTYPSPQGSLYYWTGTDGIAYVADDSAFWKMWQQSGCEVW